MGNKFVSINRCHKITSFKSLKNVPHVKISLCDGFHNGFDVENVEHLEILHCDNLKDVSMLGKVKKFSLFSSRGHGIQSLDALKDIPVLQLYLPPISKDHVVPLPPLGMNQKIICSSNYVDNEDPLLKYYNQVGVKFQKVCTFIKKNGVLAGGEEEEIGEVLEEDVAGKE